jgi:hypothetical protein
MTSLFTLFELGLALPPVMNITTLKILI